ncbi:MAG: peptidylprolyl isomerase [Vicinamibacterales bacterium]
MKRVLPLILVAALCACSKGAQTAAANTAAETPAGQTAPAQAEPIKPVPAQLPEILARVNGEAIDKAEFEKAVAAIEGQNQAPVPPDQRDQIFRGVLDQIISYKLLIQEARARKIEVPEPEIEQRIGQIRVQFPSEDAFKQAISQQGVTIEQLRADARSEMQVSKMLQTETEGKIAVKPEQVDAFYKENPSQFQQGERVRASHILIAFPQGADAAAKQQARAKAEGVLKEVKAGKDFAGLAKQHSQDPGSAPNGGDLNFFGRGQMVGPFDEAAFKLAPGQTSDLVESQFGYHIIRLTAKEPATTVQLDEKVRAQVQQFLENQARQQVTQTLLESLKAKGKIEILI